MSSPFIWEAILIYMSKWLEILIYEKSQYKTAWGFYAIIPSEKPCPMILKTDYPGNQKKYWSIGLSWLLSRVTPWALTCHHCWVLYFLVMWCQKILRTEKNLVCCIILVQVTDRLPLYKAFWCLPGIGHHISRWSERCGICKGIQEVNKNKHTHKRDYYNRNIYLRCLN